MPATMSLTVKSQPISGVPAGTESLLETVCPSIAASPLGRLWGRLCDSIPLKLCGVKLSHLLFGPLVAPFALLQYFAFKVSGDRYEVTNRFVRVRQLLTGRLRKQASLADIADVLVDVRPGQAFYHAGDLHLVNAKGESLLVLPGVSRPERLRQVILKARMARLQNDAALQTIQSRSRA